MQCVTICKGPQHSCVVQNNREWQDESTKDRATAQVQCWSNTYVKSRQSTRCNVGHANECEPDVQSAIPRRALPSTSPRYANKRLLGLAPTGLLHCDPAGQHDATRRQNGLLQSTARRGHNAFPWSRKSDRPVSECSPHRCDDAKGCCRRLGTPQGVWSASSVHAQF